MSASISWKGNSGSAIAVTALGTLIVAAVLAPALAPYAADALDLAHRRAAPSLAHWFGTDELGRDLLSRVLFGARISLAVGLFAGALCAAIGVTIGAIAGYAGRGIDDVLMRLTDAMLSVPRLPLLMIAAAVLQPGVPVLIVLVGAAGWMETARVVRAEVQSLRSREFVTAARALGATPLRVVVRHILPAVIPVATVATTLAIGRAILLESALSFFGVGVQPPAASWGNMLYQGQTTMSSEPWLAIFPGAFIFTTVLCLNMLGEGINGRHASKGES
ncbi:MAG TPA: ABC transporter permease [Gemmatimonadaceae bacterium]|nr:ABC transporter permease [Gemmatimonadaceae bacterium]